MNNDLHVPQAVKKGYISCCPNGVFDISYPNSKLRRARVQGGVIFLRPLRVIQVCVSI